MNDKTLIFLCVGAISLMIVIIMGAGAIALISTPTDEQTKNTPTPTIIPITGIMIYSIDGKTVYKTANNGSIDIVRVKDNARLWNIPVSKSKITGLELTNNDTELVITNMDNDRILLDLTSKKTCLITPTPMPVMISEPSIIPTPEIKPTVKPTQDISSMDRFVVIITPTPIAVIDKSIKIDAAMTNPVQIGSNASIKVYVETHDAPLHDILVRLNISYYNRNHEWQGLGYIPVDSGKIFSLPAHSKTEREIGPLKILNDAIVLPNGLVYNFHVWATVYKIRIDLIDKTDGLIVGSTELNNVQIVRVDQYGQRSFDW